jgi:hypothetical protein
MSMATELVLLGTSDARMPDAGALVRATDIRLPARTEGSTQAPVAVLDDVAERARVRELILSRYLPADPRAITATERAERAWQGFSGTTTAGSDGLRRTLRRSRGAIP